MESNVCEREGKLIESVKKLLIEQNVNFVECYKIEVNDGWFVKGL